MDRLRMRTTLLVPLLLLSFGCTVVSLLVIRTIVQKEVRAILPSDLRRSVKTYQNIQRQRQELLSRESALLADLPSLKALMTTHDTPTIEDAGVEFWRVSGSDFFALLDADGKLIATYNRGAVLDRTMVERGLEVSLRRPEELFCSRLAIASMSSRLSHSSLEPELKEAAWVLWLLAMPLMSRLHAR